MSKIGVMICGHGSRVVRTRWISSQCWPRKLPALLSGGLGNRLWLSGICEPGNPRRTGPSARGRL